MSYGIENFDQAWPFIEPAVERAREHTKQTVFHAISNGRARLWLLPNSAAVTTIRTFPIGRRSMHCWLLGGDLDEIKAWAKEPAQRFALRNNCDEMRLHGRRGWLRAFGWREAGTIAVQDIR
jgi:hypothetical protein